MNITVLQNKLKEGLGVVGRISSKSTNLPVLKNILLKAEDNFLNLSSTDLEIGIRWWSLVKITKKGGITVPFSSFSNFINLLPDKKINLSSKGDSVTIDCEDYETQINGINEKEFPIFPQIKERGRVSIKSDILCEGFSQIIDVPSLSRVKPEISGVFVSLGKKEVKLVATDSYRLAERKILFKKENKKDFSFIIPQKTAREFINIFKEVSKDVDIVFGDNQILFKVNMDEFDHPYIELTSKIIEGNYPDYESIIPDDFKTQIILKKEELLNKIKAASVFTGKVNEVNLSIDCEKGEMEIKSSNSDLGTYKSKIEGRAEGEKVDISFNYRFLLDGLNNIKSSEVILETNGSSDPGALKPVGKNDFLYVVMPIKN